MMRRIHPLFAIVLAVGLIGLPQIALGQETVVEGSLSLTPLTDQSYIAVELPLGELEAVRGVRWFNNDGSILFPRVMVVEAQPGQPPRLSDLLQAVDDVAAASWSWSDVELDEPAWSQGGVLYAVFHLSAHREHMADGRGGGTGIGYRHATGAPRAYFSNDGQDWVSLDRSLALAVEPIVIDGTPYMGAMGKGAAAGDEEENVKPTRVRQTAFLPVHPNPTNPSVQLRFRLALEMEVAVAIYDLRGRRVWDHRPGLMGPGEHALQWRGQDGRGQDVASGVYMVRLKAGSESFDQRVTLVR